MRNNARFLFDISHDERIPHHRFIPPNVPRVVFAIGAIAVVTAVALVKPGPAKEPANLARGAQALMSTASAQSSVAPTADPSPFGYLEFDWAAAVPGFDPLVARP
jgi:hypothetical protein